MACIHAERATARGYEEGRLSREGRPVPPAAGEVVAEAGRSRLVRKLDNRYPSGFRFEERSAKARLASANAPREALSGTEATAVELATPARCRARRSDREVEAAQEAREVRGQAEAHHASFPRGHERPHQAQARATLPRKITASSSLGRLAERLQRCWRQIPEPIRALRLFHLRPPIRSWQESLRKT